MLTELKPGLFWIGIVDWGLRHFHGHELSTHRGSSYNSYLIKDEKIAVVDTAWTPFQEEFIRNVREVVEPAKIDYVIANHSEVDHSGSLPALMRLCPNATLVVSKRGLESVEGHYHQPWKFQAVGTGDSISLGRNKLVFVEAPMLHWPDSMFTYVAGMNVLLPNDAFGQHYATPFRFNDEVDQSELFEEALKYYANILTPYSKFVLKKIDEVVAMKLPVDMICPSHGVLWRKDPLQIVAKYQEWAQQKPAKSAVILYDTMWEGTRRMAEAVGTGLGAEGVPYKIFHMATTDRNDAITEVFKAKAVIVGSPTLNQGILPTIMPVLEDLRGLRFQNKIGAAFGTYGWSGEGPRVIEEHLAAAKIPVAAESVKAKWQPRATDLAACEAMGRKMAAAVKAG